MKRPFSGLSIMTMYERGLPGDLVNIALTLRAMASWFAFGQAAVQFGIRFKYCYKDNRAVGIRLHPNIGNVTLSPYALFSTLVEVSQMTVQAQSFSRRVSKKSLMRPFQ